VTSKIYIFIPKTNWHLFSLFLAKKIDEKAIQEDFQERKSKIQPSNKVENKVTS
jgi:hypothetical protein